MTHNSPPSLRDSPGQARQDLPSINPLKEGGRGREREGEGGRGRERERESIRTQERISDLLFDDSLEN